MKSIRTMFQATAMVVFAILVSLTAQAQCDTTGMRPDPTGQGRYWMTGRRAPLSVFTTQAYEGSNSLRGLQLMQAAQAGLDCQKFWNEFPDHAEEVMLSPSAPLMVEIDRDQVSVVFLDGCRMHGKRYYNRLTPSEQQVETPPPSPPPVYLPAAQPQVAYNQPQVIVMQSPPITITNTNTNENHNKANAVSASVSIARAAADIISDITNRQGQRSMNNNQFPQLPRQQFPRQMPPVQQPAKTDGPSLPGNPSYDPFGNIWRDQNGNIIPPPANIPPSGRGRPLRATFSGMPLFQPHGSQSTSFGSQPRYGTPQFSTYRGSQFGAYGNRQSNYGSRPWRGR